MAKSVYLRPLRIEDAQISYRWRNNPKIWRFTGNRPDQYITPEMETEWLGNVLKRKNEMRFAICLEQDDKYIGNIFFTDITDTDAQLHIFIGDIDYWGGGRVYEAARQIIDYAFEELKLQTIYNYIKKGNVATLVACKRLGFQREAELEGYLVKHIFTKEMHESGNHLVYVHKSEHVTEGR